MDSDTEEIREQDKFLPIANVSRIMKKALPANAKISKEAKECVQECVSEFICFVTSEANDKCISDKRKTINGEDIIDAMRTLGFDNYLDALSVYLERYRDSISKAEKEAHLKSEKDYTSDSSYGQWPTAGRSTV
eukprot:TRINITY_DN21229_c0_g1::TRINITY_DN21229_c0_g1_i1::g.30078::m.30078 TRINITY_DN21229_c0_g1::TRINITY_DN21229_c0_g1_i1::g.30078  ORF type:complete len:134 (-),score=8.53,sp/Q5QMG3/NFYB2_ORYSJ/69.47/1e-44,CBFD_NFYB_HMF/PF00808.18/1.1e-25,Histone/PF00125.19/1e-06,PAN_3/PF08277.7/0.0012,TFIID-18kDa/PF02269.11/0.0095 TRINITY_DN21229_c0_g1_i1:79-480(-)